MEALELRVKDVDPDRCEIHVRDGKGRKDRRTMLSQTVVRSSLTLGTRPLNVRTLGGKVRFDCASYSVIL